MLGKLFGSSGPLIVRQGDGTVVIHARARLLGGIVFATMAFLIFFAVDRARVVAEFGEQVWWGAMVIAAVSFLIGIARLRDTRPLITVGPAGIGLPRLFADVLPWEDVAEVQFKGSMVTVLLARERRLQWYPKISLRLNGFGEPGSGFLSRYEIPWVKTRLNYLWPVSTTQLRQLIKEERPAPEPTPEDDDQ